MADARIRAVITAEDKASPVVQKFAATTVAVGVAIGNAISNVTSRAVNELSNDLGDAIKRVDTLNNANRTFQNMGFQVGEVKSAIGKLNDSILGLPTPLDQAVQGMTMIASATNDVGKSQAIFSALNDGILGFGGSTEMVSNAVLQLSQDLAGGRIQAQTWNSLLNSGLGPTLAAIARQMGITTGALKEGLSDGSISVDKFTDQLISMDKNGGGGMKSLHKIAMDSTNGIQTSFANARTAIVRSMAKIIDTIGQKNIADTIKKIGDTFADMITGIGSFITNHKEQIRSFFEGLWNVLKDIGSALVFIYDHRDVFVPLVAGVVGAIATFKTLQAMMLVRDAIQGFMILGQTIVSFVASSVAQFGALGTAKLALDTVISTPMVLAVSIGAALALIAYAYMKVQELKAAIDGANNSARVADDAYDRMVKNARSQYAAGKISKERLNALTAGRASGGPVTAGTPYMVGEVGKEMFIPSTNGTIVPNHQLNNSSPSTINITVQAGAFMGNPSDARKYAQLIADHLKDVAGAKGMTAAQLLGA